LQSLSESVRQIARGERSRGIDVAAHNEIHELAVDVTSLSRQLRDAEAVASRITAAESQAVQLKGQLNEVQMSYDHILLVNELGQDIASSLNLEDILTKLYDRVNSMMDAAIFALGVYSEQEQMVSFRQTIERGKRIAPYTVSMNDKDSLAAWCVRNGKEVFLNNVQRDYARYVSNLSASLSGSDGSPKSLIFLPMFAKQRPIGVICVQSFHENAYTSYHVDMIRSLSLFTGAALDNARAYEELGKVLKNLRSAQEQLVQSEKMSSLGLLTAGIAHEINNPINFVSGNVNPLRRDFEDLAGILKMYESADVAGDLKSAVLRIRKEASDLDLTYTLDEINKLLNGIEEGANRTAEIVRGLRNFSRLDENEIKIADVHEGLDSTLTLLRSKYRDRIEIERAYAEIPKIECYPGQLNQVFMNILSNAVQAIAEKGTIRLATEALDENRVRIRIKDSGSGMSDAVKKKIFDPFFTTKDVGVGTGLGLSISYGIIEKHNGHIGVESSPGNGTEFIITLPVHQPKAMPAE